MATPNRTWTLSAILNAIHEMHAAGKPLTTTAVLAEDPCLHAAVRRRFGNWYTALGAMGLTAVDPWSVEQVVQALRDRAQNGESLMREEVARKDAALLVAAERLLGSWAKALARAGLEETAAAPDRRTALLSAWTPERVIETLRRQRAEGRPVRKAQLQVQEPGLIEAAVHYFGSWAGARGAAFPEELERRWGPERVIAMIQELAESGRPLTTTVIQKECQLLCRYARRYFGSWQGALEAAGVAEQAAQGRRPRKPRGSWTKKAVIEAVWERASLGLPITYAETRRQDPSLVSAGCRLFGNWTNTLTAAHAAVRKMVSAS